MDRQTLITLSVYQELSWQSLYTVAKEVSYKFGILPSCDETGLFLLWKKEGKQHESRIQA